MKSLFAVSILILAFCVVSFAQTNQIEPCPGISITGPGSRITTGETAFFTAFVDDNSVNYNWTISRGTIIEGQNSPVIKVVTTPDDAGSNIIATVEVKGLPENCAKTASVSVSVGYTCRLPIELDDYEKISFKEEKVRLANVAAYLINQPEARAFFIIYFPEKQKLQIKNYTEKVSNYLTQTLKIPKDRLTFIWGESETQRTRISIVPKDALEYQVESGESIVKN